MAADGSSRSSTPLCHFLSPPFRVGDVCHGTLPLRHPRLPAPAPLSWRRGRNRARRREYLHRCPPAHVKAHVLLNTPRAALAPRKPPPLDQLLGTIRDAWPLPRSRSLDSKKRGRPKVITDTMRIWEKEASARISGLPYRRYSVPEAVMRKYALSRSQTSASDVMTNPTPSVPSIISTSQGSAVKRMSNKACQTSDNENIGNSAGNVSKPSIEICEVPAVNITFSSNNIITDGEVFSKHSSNSEFSQSEEVLDCFITKRNAYGSELSLPGAVTESNMFLTVPESPIDYHERIPKTVVEEDCLIRTDVIQCTLTAYSENDSNDSRQSAALAEEESLESSLQKTEANNKREKFTKSKSKSVPESRTVLVKEPQRSGSANSRCLSRIVVNSADISVFMEEDTPTPVFTCHTGNMSECYITDCDMCNAEGRKCCSIDDSGSQSFSFTSPEIISTNELKSSSDFMTSSITLDQTVSDRTLSTQDSTMSLTSITPENGDVKNYMNLNISPTLVINSESSILGMVSVKRKTRDLEIYDPSEISVNDSLKPLDLIQPESCQVLENKTANEYTGSQTNTELNNNNTKNVLIESTFKESNTRNQTSQFNLSQISSSEVVVTSNKLDIRNTEMNNVEITSTEQKIGNYDTNYLYLTEDESGTIRDTIKDSCDDSFGPTKENFEMDSSAVTASAEDDSNLLEHLGFCENLSQLLYKPTASTTCAVKSDLKETSSQENFCGNTKYELILKDISNKTNFKGNVMPKIEEAELTLPYNESQNEMLPMLKTDVEIVLPHNVTSINDKSNHLKEKTPKEEDTNELPPEEATSIGSVAGGTYWDLPGKELVIPRFSALPRTISMIVNTSSIDCSSDSDLSLSDSLEDSKSSDKSKGLDLFHKYDNRMVRGDIIALLPEENECSRKLSNGAKAYFLSLTGEEGEIKIESIPEELKQKLMKRDKQIKKHSNLTNQSKSKTCPKRNRKEIICINTNSSHTISAKTIHLTKTENRLSKFTQWEDLGSSKESTCSETLVPSDFSDKDVSTVLEEGDLGGQQTKDASTSPHNLKALNNLETNHIDRWLDTVNSKYSCCDANDEDKRHAINACQTAINGGTTRLVDKWVQCEDMPHVDSVIDKEISDLLIDNFKTDNVEQGIDSNRFKCIEHQVPWSKNNFTQVSQNDLTKKDNKNSNYEDSLKSKRTINEQDEKVFQYNNCTDEKHTPDDSRTIEYLSSEPPSSDNNCDSFEPGVNISSKNDDSNNEGEELRCRTPVFGEHSLVKNERSNASDSITIGKNSSKPNLKTSPTRRPGNLSSRFRQKFEVIPEEKSGSIESSNDEKKNPVATKGRRASMSHEINTINTKVRERKSSTSGTDRQENVECDNVRNIETSQIEMSDYHRRHTIHGNIASKNIQPETNSYLYERNEQSRRHTIHGSLALSPKDSMIKQLNLLGGTLLKGRVIGKQSGVMFGRFRPVNEETQVQKDERSLVEEHIERLKRDASKGREALAVAKTEEQEELLTLSKGWINFYLLRDSQEMGSENSIDDEECKETLEETRRAPPAMKTVTVMGKPDGQCEEVRHQYAVQLTATPECQPQEELPRIGSNDDVRATKNINKSKHSTENIEQRADKVHSTDDQNLRYLKLSSLKQELQTEKTYYARSGEMVCSDESISSKSSSSSVSADSPTLPSIRWPSRQLQRRSFSRHRVPPPSQQACWTVTLAGSSGHPSQPPPDVEMRLSFSNSQPRGAATSQSDSGLGEDGPRERAKALPPPNNQWKVMLKAQQETDRSEQIKHDKRQTSLPEFTFTPSTTRSKTSAKSRGQEVQSRPLSVKVQEVLEHNISLHKRRLTEGEWVEGLSVTGLAITPERKPRVPTMSERDLTRQWCHRARIFH